MKRKGILFISTEYPPAPGGIAYHAFYLVRELRKLGWRTAVASEQDNASETEIANFNRNSPYPVFRLLPTPSLFLLLKKVAVLILRTLQLRPAILIGTGKHGSWFAYLVARITFRKCVLIGHGTEFTVTMSERSKKINRWVYSRCDYLICVSNYTKETAERTGIRNKNTAVIVNGADDESFKQLKQEEVIRFKEKNTIQQQKIIVTVGYVTTRKGQEWVIRAMPQVVSKIPAAHYYCIGLPGLQKEFEQIALEIGASNNVHFLGKLETDEMVRWLNACDIFAMTSAMNEGDFEGFGIAVIEAALCGKPAIVTNQSGLAEAIIENITGLGIKEKDYGAIAEKIIFLLSNNEIRTQMGEQARSNALQYLTWRKIAARYDEVYVKLSSQSR